jgi:uncharacterized protein with GYD domain
MAKRMRKAQESGKGPIKFDEGHVVYMYLITRTAKGRAQKDSVLQIEQQLVTTLVSQLGGTCELYSVQGAYDYVSVVKAVPAVGAIQILQVIETGGNRKAIMLPAFRMLK